MMSKPAAALAAALIALASQVPAPAASASSGVPFADENANGTITLCGRNGQALTSGSLMDVPFVWKAVSSSPAPTGYTRAYLALYQPIEHEDPGNWTGYPMTDVSVFSNPAHPVAQATNLDSPLLEPDRQIPPYWDGLYELRMFYTGRDVEPFTSSYPVAVIRVSGTEWSLASGGGASCSSGSAVSVAARDASATALATPQTVSVGPPTTVSATTGHPSGASPSSPAATTAHPTGSTASGPTTSTATTSPSAGAVALGPTRSSRAGRPSGGSSTGLVLEVAAAVIAAGGAVAALLWRRRRTAV